MYQLNHSLEHQLNHYDPVVSCNQYHSSSKVYLKDLPESRRYHPVYNDMADHHSDPRFAPPHGKFSSEASHGFRSSMGEPCVYLGPYLDGGNLVQILITFSHEYLFHLLSRPLYY